MKNIIGRKIGMTQIFTEDGALIPVTVIQAVPNVVVQKKTVETDGYNAVQLGFEEIAERKVNKPKKGHFDKAGVKYKRYLKEFRVEDADQFEIGQEIKVDGFEAGDLVDAIGKSKGKGTQGVIKRHGFGRGRESHGSKFHRMPGGMGASTYPGKVFKNHRMMGPMGNEKVTIQNLEVIKVDSENHLLLVKGAVPGPRKGIVVIRKAIKSK